MKVEAPLIKEPLLLSVQCHDEPDEKKLRPPTSPQPHSNTRRVGKNWCNGLFFLVAVLLCLGSVGGSGYALFIYFSDIWKNGFTAALLLGGAVYASVPSCLRVMPPCCPAAVPPRRRAAAPPRLRASLSPFALFAVCRAVSAFLRFMLTRHTDTAQSSRRPGFGSTSSRADS